MRRFFAEGAMSSAFIPLFSKMRKSTDALDNEIDLVKEEFYFTVFWLLGTMMIAVVLLGITFSEFIASFLFILQDSPTFMRIEETTLLLRVLFPYIGFVSLCALQQAVMENHGKFAYSASVPILFNLIIITISVSVLLIEEEALLIVSFVNFLGFSVWDKHLAQTIIVSLGVILGGVGQLSYAYLNVRYLGYRVFLINQRGNRRKKIRECFSHPSARKFLFLLLPVFLSSGSYQIQILLTEPITLSLGEGAVSILYFANRLLEFPLGIVGVAITTASLPLLSQAAKDLHDDGKGEKFIFLIHYALNIVYILFFPVLIVSAFYPETIVSIVFEFNRFNRQDTLDTALVFLVLIPSLFSLAGYRILFNVFYARENTRTPLLIASINLFLGLPLAYILTRFHPHPAMIALSSTVSSYVILGVAIHLLHRVGISLWGYFWERIRFFLRVGILVIPIFYIMHRLINPIFRILEKMANHSLMVKLIYLMELSFFSLWVFIVTLMVLILFREPIVMKFFPVFNQNNNKND